MYFIFFESDAWIVFSDIFYCINHNCCFKKCTIHFVQIVQTGAEKFELAKKEKISLTKCLYCVGSVLNVHKRTKDRQKI